MELGLDDSWSDAMLILGLGAEDDAIDDDDEGLGVIEELALPVDSLEVGLDMSPELRLGLELL